MKRILSRDPQTGKQVVYHEDADSLVIETSQDVEPLLDFNREQAADYPRSVVGRDAVLAARIPLHVLYAIPADLRADPKYMREWINKHPQYKIWQGKL